jgi:hypothetical protein
VWGSESGSITSPSTTAATVVVGATVVGGIVVAALDVVAASDAEAGGAAFPAVPELDEQPARTHNVLHTATIAAARVRRDRRVVARSIRPPGPLPGHATLMPVPEKITIVLPVDAEAPPERPLAAGLESFRGASIGFVDNGLWRSMTVTIEGISAHAGAGGAKVAGVTPFDHLAADFPRQRAALAPFAETVDAVITGLGN